MPEQKDDKSLKDIHTDYNTELKVKSNKNKYTPIVKIKNFKPEKDLAALYEYECENCKHLYSDKVACCQYCGSKFIKKVDSGKKYCYLDSGHIKLTSSVVLPEHQKMLIVSFISLIVLISLIVAVAFSFNTFIEHKNVLYMCWLILEIMLITILSRFFSDIMDRIDGRNNHKTYLFIKDYDYGTRYDENHDDMSKKGPWSIVYVTHRLENGTELTLKSNLIVSSEDKNKKVDVLINMDDYNDYEIGFDLDNKIKRFSKR